MKGHRILSVMSTAGWIAKLCTVISHSATQWNREAHSSQLTRLMELIEHSQRKNHPLHPLPYLEHSRLVTHSRLATTNALEEEMEPLRKSTWRNKNHCGPCHLKRDHRNLGVMLVKQSRWSIPLLSTTSAISTGNVTRDHSEPCCHKTARQAI